MIRNTAGKIVTELRVVEIEIPGHWQGLLGRKWIEPRAAFDIIDQDGESYCASKPETREEAEALMAAWIADGEQYGPDAEGWNENDGP